MVYFRKDSHDMFSGTSNTEVDDDIPLINFSDEFDAEMTSTLQKYRILI